jgi:hypothetical protein
METLFINAMILVLPDAMTIQPGSQVPHLTTGKHLNQIGRGLNGIDVKC